MKSYHQLKEMKSHHHQLGEINSHHQLKEMKSHYLQLGEMKSYHQFEEMKSHHELEKLKSHICVIVICLWH